MERGYQYGFSDAMQSMYDADGRVRKAKTMVAVLADFYGKPLNTLRVLNVGSSTGIIDHYLADHFRAVTCIDIDDKAIAYAQANFSRDNLQFTVGDAMQMPYPDQSFDVVICAQVYEHVPDAQRMMKEIQRVLVQDGVCYFAANNRLMLNEPHYNLPLLSVIPRPLAHLYVRLSGKASYYHELHYSYWGLKQLVRPFVINDYTLKLVNEPVRFGTEYMVRPGSLKAKIAGFIARYMIWLSPGYIWVLRKPS